jgi:hypothetical protein
MYEGAKPALSKVPEVTLGFWVIKILGTTIGETGGDAVTMSLFHADKDANNGGYLIGTSLFMAVFIATVAIQITMKRFGQCRKGYRSRPLRKWRLVRDRPGHADGHSLGDGHGMVNLRHVKVPLLCQRTGTTYPLDYFIQQVSAVLAKLDNAKGNWVGTSLPARTAAAVQRLADANFPLRPDQAQGLLRILDALIDLGDRRSAALEQTEAFKGVQARSSIR